MYINLVEDFQLGRITHINDAGESFNVVLDIELMANASTPLHYVGILWVGNANQHPLGTNSEDVVGDLIDQARDAIKAYENNYYGVDKILDNLDGIERIVNSIEHKSPLIKF